MEKKTLTLERIQLFLLALFLFGLIYSFFLQSVAVIFLIVSSFFNDRLRPDLDEVRAYLSAFRRPDVWGFSLLFFSAILPSAFGTDWPYYFEKLIIKLPFLFLPAALLRSKAFDRSHLRLLGFIASGVLLIQCGLIFADFLTNPVWWADNLKRGKSLITPGNHIRFSVILSFLVLFHLHSLLFERPQKKLDPILNAVFGIIFVLFLHFLSVRSGLLILYVGVFILVSFYTVKRKAWLIAFSIGTALIALPAVFYHTVDVFKNKVDYMVYDVKQFKSGTGSSYADSGRLASMYSGFEVFQQNPLSGAGNNGIKSSVADLIERKFPDYPRDLLPHNQFLFTLAAGGILGLILLIGGLFIPFFPNKLYEDPLAASYLAALFTFFMIDHPLEVTTGVGITLLFYFWAKKSVYPSS